MNNKFFIGLITIVSLFIFTTASKAQTSAFTFQGKLNDGGTAANGTYQFQFKLYDTASGGSQLGSSIADLPATVTSGIFSVNLDFGANAFDGAARFLEIGVRLNGSGQPYTILNPRQTVTSTPYAVKSLNAENATTATTAGNAVKLGNVPAAQYTQNDDARLSDARTPTPFSTYYIQNGTSQQATSNFNVSGEGKANILTATAQFNIGANRILSNAGFQNLFVGTEAGTSNTGAGNSNSFVGALAGQNNTTGASNSFFGLAAGRANIDGNFNSFFGRSAGTANTSGTSNSFVGSNSGQANTIGSFNVFFGRSAGAANLSGGDNAFIGQSAGLNNNTGSFNSALGSGAGISNMTGANNTFVGYLAGQTNTTENDNTFIGYKTNGSSGITNATAIGANAFVNQSNTMVLGTNAVTVKIPGNLTVANTFSANALDSATVYKIAGNRVFHLTGTNNTSIGFESGNSITTGNTNAFFGSYSGKGTTSGINNAFFGSYAGRDNIAGGNNAFFGANAGISNNASFNAFFGSASGFSNTAGTNNSYFGNSTGINNSTGDNNSFFGSNAGKAVADSSFNSFYGSFSGEKTTSGAGNAFFGAFAGRENTVGYNNTFIGYKAGQTPTTGNGNVVIGYNASVAGGASNSVAIGANVTVNQSNRIVIGQSTDRVDLGQVYAASLFTSDLDVSSLSATYGDFYQVETDTLKTGKIEATSTTPSEFKAAKIENLEASKLDVYGNTNVNGSVTANTLQAFNLPGGGSFNICGTFALNASIIMSQCSSSLRYKNNVQNFTRGLELVKTLRPVTFNWKDGGKLDIGFVAEEVNAAEPLLSTFNEQGTVEGVKYAQITTALVNAVKEQQTQIETQDAQNQKLQDQIKQQQAQIDALKLVLCAANSGAAICQPKK